MILEYRRQAKTQCTPLSRLMSSLLKQSPGIRPNFFNQKMAQKEPEKNMPSTAANAIMCSAKLAAVELHHLSAHCAFHWTQGTVSIACRSCVFFVGSLMYMSMRSECVSLWIFSTAIWKPWKHLASADVTSVAKLLLRFLLTMPLEAAKKARTCKMKRCSVVESLSQSVASLERLISSAVQKEASAFLYILQMSSCWMGKRTKR